MNITTVDLLKQHCLQNKYSKWYFNIIDSAMGRGWERSTSPCYVEGHHVVPRSISGDSMKSGVIVFLTAREKISAANKGKLAKEKHPLWNVGHSLETKKKMSNDRKGCIQPRRWFNDGVKQYYVLPENAEASWVTGKLSHLCYSYGKVGFAHGKKWFNDPINRIEKYFTPGQQPDGYIQGRLK